MLLLDQFSFGRATAAVLDELVELGGQFLAHLGMLDRDVFLFADVLGEVEEGDARSGFRFEVQLGIALLPGVVALNLPVPHPEAVVATPSVVLLDQVRSLE